MILKYVTIEPDFGQKMMDTAIVQIHQHGAGARWAKQANDQTMKRQPGPER
ncbi:hypothetical protein ACE6ED_06440 [Paenibacillus sp. CN-4]|uniref:hypothetical protein n=1 Tax=Paenibacillus nanchangensis TaxID=3348343 RepID=UPI00397E400D